VAARVSAALVCGRLRSASLDRGSPPDGGRPTRHRRRTPHGLVEVRASGADADIDSPVPVLVVREDGTEVELVAGTHRVTVRTGPTPR